MFEAPGRSLLQAHTLTVLKRGDLPKWVPQVMVNKMAVIILEVFQINFSEEIQELF